MRGAYYVITALLVVASSQTSADSSHQLQVYDHDVVAAENAAAKTLPQQSLRGSRDASDDLAHEDRAIISELVEEGAKLIPRAAKNVEEMPRVAEKDAALGADGAFNKLRNTATDAIFQDISTRELKLSFKEWNTEIEPMRDMPMPKQYLGKIKSVHEAFVKLCDKDLNPTFYYTARLWSLFEMDVKAHPATFHRQTLIQFAKENVREDVLRIKSIESEWDRWNEVSIPDRVNVLNMLLHQHFMRWARMYLIFGKHRSELIDTPSKVARSRGGTTGISRGTALRNHLNAPLNAASTSKDKSSVLTFKSQRTFDGNPKQSKVQNSELVKPVFTKSAISDDHPVFSKNLKLSSEGPSAAFAPYRSGDNSVSTKNSKVGVGGTNSAFVPYKPPSVPIF